MNKRYAVTIKMEVVVVFLAEDEEQARRAAEDISSVGAVESSEYVHMETGDIWELKEGETVFKTEGEESPNG